MTPAAAPHTVEAPVSSGVLEITYSPPGACCLPTPLVFVPVGP